MQRVRESGALSSKWEAFRPFLSRLRELCREETERLSQADVTDDAKETESSRCDTLVHIGSQRVCGSTHETCTGSQVGSQHWEGEVNEGSRPSPRSYLPLTSAGKGKIGSLQCSLTEYINHTPGQAWTPVPQLQPMADPVRLVLRCLSSYCLFHVLPFGSHWFSCCCLHTFCISCLSLFQIIHLVMMAFLLLPICHHYNWV